MPGLEWMKPLQNKRKRRLPVKPDGQLTLGFGLPQQREILPDTIRRNWVALLARMLLAAIKNQIGSESHER